MLSRLKEGHDTRYHHKIEEFRLTSKSDPLSKEVDFKSAKNFWRRNICTRLEFERLEFER